KPDLLRCRLSQFVTSYLLDRKCRVARSLAGLFDGGNRSQSFLYLGVILLVQRLGTLGLDTLFQCVVFLELFGLERNTRRNYCTDLLDLDLRLRRSGNRADRPDWLYVLGTDPKVCAGRRNNFMIVVLLFGNQYDSVAAL
ncbi:MAG: hypothetical protein JSV99_01130, partial [Planctomycetota bacterium]